MKKAKIRIGNTWFLIKDEITTIGRAPDNKIRIEDINVSRYHAEIEYRDGNFWFTDLKSSNGSLLNGNPVNSTTKLQNSDIINLGGTTEIEFIIEEEATKTEKAKTEKDRKETLTKAPSNYEESLPTAIKRTRTFPVVLLAFLLLAIGLISALLIFKPVTECKAKVLIETPENGEVIVSETEISLNVQQADCIEQIVISLNDQEIVYLTEEPFSTKIDPKDFPELADGGSYPLQIFVEDKNGNRILSDTIFLAFETAAPLIPEEKPEEKSDSSLIETDKEKSLQTHKLSLIEIQQMIQKIMNQFSKHSNYKFEEEFLKAVRQKTEEYTKEEGFFERANTYRDLINIEFHKENGLDAPLGFLLAMSRSKFKLEKGNKLEGLWQLSDEFVKSNGYKNLCPEDELSKVDQICAAKTTAVYLKSLMFKIFGGDLIYTVAAFGMSEQEASLWAANLPQKRENFWIIIRNPRQRENVVRFFAASIVADNPNKFDLKKDKPISTLYRSLILTSSGSNL